MAAVTVELPPATEQRLRDRAAAAGLSAADYLAALADQSLTDDPLAAAVARLTGRSPEQVAADRAAVLATARRGRPLPAGKTLAEAVEGTWPGDEPDAAIRSALDRLS